MGMRSMSGGRNRKIISNLKGQASIKLLEKLLNGELEVFERPAEKSTKFSSLRKSRKFGHDFEDLWTKSQANKTIIFPLCVYDI